MCVLGTTGATHARATLEARSLLQRMAGERGGVWGLDIEYPLPYPQTDPDGHRQLGQRLWRPRLPWGLHQSHQLDKLDCGQYRGHSVGL